MERHAVEGAPKDLERFRENTQGLLAALGTVPPPELLDQAASAMEALRQHNQDAVEYLRRPVAELQAKVKLLTAAITAVSSSSEENIRRLQQIKGKVLASADAREFRSLRTQLAECLDGVLAAAERQRAESERAAEQLNRPSQPLKPAVSADGPSTADPTTSLPVRAEAETAIAQACQDEAKAFVVVMVVNRVEDLNRSSGEQLGDAILQRFAGFVRTQLPDTDQLFRWTGPVIVALVWRRKPPDAVRGEIESLLLPKLEHAVVTETGRVLLPISTRWTVLPLMASPRLLFHKMDAFAGVPE
jgi:GGDEF domain-containing protein